MDLITIITPYFKKKKFIKEAIISILNQTYKNFEVIIIYDDKDKVDLKYIKELKNLDKRINLLVNKKNIGAGLSRNLAMNRANGNYIAFLDSDDIWHNNKLETQLKFMKSNDLKISHTSYQILDIDKKILGKRIARNFNQIKDLLKSCDIGLSTVMLKKKIISRNCSFTNSNTKEDFVLWLRILEKNYKIGGLNKILTSWRRLDGSLSSSSIQKLIDGFNVYFKYMNFGLIKSTYYLICLSINYLKK